MTRQKKPGHEYNIKNTKSLCEECVEFKMKQYTD